MKQLNQEQQDGSQHKALSIPRTSNDEVVSNILSWTQDMQHRNATRKEAIIF